MDVGPSNPAAIFHRKGGEGWGPKGGDPNPAEVGVRRVGVRRVRGGSLEWGAKGGGPKISLFFLFLPSEISLFLLSLGLFVEFWFCFPGGPEAATTREPRRAHLRVPAFKKDTKIQREDPQEREERVKFRQETEKKAKFWVGPAERRSGRGVVLGRGSSPTRAKHVDQKKGNVNKSKSQQNSKTQQNTQKNTQHTPNTHTTHTHTTHTTHTETNHKHKRHNLAKLGLGQSRP